MLETIMLRAGIILLVLGIIILVDYFLIGRQFSPKRMRARMQKRVQEIRHAMSYNAERDEERVKLAMQEYVNDERIALRDMVLLTISQSGLKINYLQFILFSICFAIFGFFVGIMMHNLWLTIFIPVTFSQIMFFVIRFAFHRRQAAFRSRSSEVMSQINNLYGTSQNLLMATLASIETMPQPFYGLFQTLRRDQSIMSLDDAIDRALRSVIDPNFRLALILIRESEKTGINVEREWNALCEIYEDEKDIRMTMANEMNKEKTEALVLGIIPVILLIVGFVLMGGEVNRLLAVPWINNMMAIIMSMVIIGFLLLPRIFMLDLE